MKLRRESAENGDFSGPKGEFKKLFSGRNRIEIPSGRKIVFWTEKAPLSALAVAGFMKNMRASSVVKNGSVVSILRVLTKRGGDDEKTGGVSTEIR